MSVTLTPRPIDFSVEYGPGDDLTDYTTAFADATSRQVPVYLGGQGTWLTDTVDFTNSLGTLHGVDENSYIKQNAGTTLPLVDFSNRTITTPKLQESSSGLFTLVGNGENGAVGLKMTEAFGLNVHDVGIRNTGGEGLWIENTWGHTLQQITVARPVNADVNNVPYIRFRGYVNACRFIGVGLRSIDSGSPDAVDGAWRIEGDATNNTKYSTFVGCWSENQHPPEGSAVFDWELGGRCVVEFPQMADLKSGSIDTTANSAMWLRDPPIKDVGGNYIYGIIPGDGDVSNQAPIGLRVSQSRNRIEGVKGFNGLSNIVLDPGVQFTHISMGGQDSGVAGEVSVIDNSGETSNTIYDPLGGGIAHSVLTKHGFYGAAPVGQGAAIADATDAASTQAGLNSLLAYLRSRGDIAT